MREDPEEGRKLLLISHDLGSNKELHQVAHITQEFERVTNREFNNQFDSAMRSSGEYQPLMSGAVKQQQVLEERYKRLHIAKDFDERIKDFSFNKRHKSNRIFLTSVMSQTAYKERSAFSKTPNSYFRNLRKIAQ